MDTINQTHPAEAERINDLLDTLGGLLAKGVISESEWFTMTKQILTED